MSGAATPLDSLYPAGPAQVPADLTKPTPAYRRHAWIASGVLLLFAAAYVALTGWFVVTAYRLTMVALGGSGSGAALLIAGCSAFMAIFMLKALFFLQARVEITHPEVTPATQPRLFAFLHRLADEAGAPRPHRVFVSPAVNAAVFYDLSVLNLLFPSKKNLEIGLGLVNVLSLDEFKAVCAHEFGHFAQRSMAVGRWVYTSQQIAAAIIAKRDALDRFLGWLSRIDFRIAWVGWVLSLIIWSVRSLLESVFTLVVLAHRALSREMEFQADLVAVSLTGSDALIHALHKLQAADDAWDRTLNFASQQAGEHKQKVRDLFVAQTRLLERMRELLGDENHGRRPGRTASDPAAHRIFRAELAQPPRMWSTHPPNNEREDNAKRTYLTAAADDRPAWEIFTDAQALREKISADLITLPGESSVQEPEETIRRIDEQFAAEPLRPAYRGVYLGRSPVAAVESAAALYDAELAAVTQADLDALYPAALTTTVEELRGLEREKSMLEALKSGQLTTPDGVIRYRGKQIQASELPAAIAAVQASVTNLQNELAAHDRRCRTVHRAIARQLGGGWEGYLVSVASLLHYADHAEANLLDAHATLGHMIAVEAATGRVSGGGVNRILVEAKDVHRALSDVHVQAEQVGFDPELAKLFRSESMKEALGAWELPAPEEGNIGEWLGVVDSWVQSAAGPLNNLKSAALERLLLVEAQLAGQFRRGTTGDAAPPPCRAPSVYRAMTPANLRPKEAKLSWWARFQTANGMAPAVARTAAALAIVGAVLVTGAMADESVVYVYNGLAREVAVTVGAERATVAPGERAVLKMSSAGSYAVSARTVEGALIESFQAPVGTGERRHLYSIAGAVPLVRWTAVYGAGTEGSAAAPEPLGAPRWMATNADHLFEDPPRSVSLKRNRTATRVVVTAASSDAASLAGAVSGEERRRAVVAHARWDPETSLEIGNWLGYLPTAAPQEAAAVVAARVRDNPNGVVTLRAQQEIARGKDQGAVCAEQSARAQASPDNADLQYLAARCLAKSDERNRAFAAGNAKWPQNPWFAYAHGHTLSGLNRWAEAEQRFVTVLNTPPLARLAAEQTARLRAMQGRDAFESQLTARSPLLRSAQQVAAAARLDSAQPANPVVEAFRALGEGRLADALKLAQSTPAESKMLALVATSRGPGEPGVTERALRTPAADVDGDTLWPLLALALRLRQDAGLYWGLVETRGNPDVPAVRRFVDLVQAGDFAAAEAALGKQDLETRARLFAMAAVLREGNVPRDWLEIARRALFVFERPYL